MKFHSFICSSAKRRCDPDAALWLHPRIGSAVLFSGSVVELRFRSNIGGECELGKEGDQCVLHLHEAEVSPCTVSRGFRKGEKVCKEEEDSSQGKEKEREKECQTVFVPLSIWIKDSRLRPRCWITMDGEERKEKRCSFWHQKATHDFLRVHNRS